MYCLKQNCIYDSFPRTGEHVCAYGRCVCLTAREVAGEAAELIQKEKLTGSDQMRLDGLKAAYGRLPGSG